MSEHLNQDRTDGDAALPTMAGSTPSWPARADYAGRPNVIVVLIDDLGYADLGCFGSEIETPNIDALAAEGLRYTDFHVTPMCSPTRAALMTGRNSHAVGFGTVFGDPGFDGYTHELPEDALSMAEVFRHGGYRTMMVGKWHLSKDHDRNEGGELGSWPVQRGFDRYYGILDAFTNLHHPHRLYRDNHPVEVDTYPDDYYLTDDLTDEAIGMIRETKLSNPERPFFLYVAHPAVHAPLHARPEDMAKYAGRYDQGWDATREQRFTRQQELGVVDAEVTLAPRNDEPGLDVPAWDGLTDDQRRLSARHMEAYAAMVDRIDQSFGRIKAALEELDEWDNTIVVFTSDNGASGEGHPFGTTSYLRVMGADPDVDEVAEDIERIDLIGGPRLMTHYPRGWAMTSNTPFRLYKRSTFAGGQRVPMIIRGPGVDDAGGLREQYLHVIDLLPTLLGLTGVEPPTHRAEHPAQPFQGRDFADTISSPEAASPRTEQYYEINGDRGFHRDGWEILTRRTTPEPTFSEAEWQLFDVRTDPTQLTDLAEKHPDQVRELAAGWRAAAEQNHVLPLDEGLGFKVLYRSAAEDVYRKPVRIPGGAPSLERVRSCLLTLGRSFRIEARGTRSAGDEGYLISHGDQGVGYGLFIKDDEVTFVFTEHGRSTRYAGGSIGVGEMNVEVDVSVTRVAEWNVSLKVNGEVTAELPPLPSPPGRTPFEGIDVGLCRRSPIDWELYEQHGSFAWPGDDLMVTIHPGDEAEDGPTARLARLRDAYAARDINGTG
ncbi:arylsulfatase [Enemella sp. A6]|uniref:arylsulfatase n=1 Tax=Enemella sp. A6 TaxID=3440152 RepID=UPI003EB69DD6